MPRAFFASLSLLFFLNACSPNNVTVDASIGKYFDSAGLKGSFGFYDNGQGHFTLYNLARFKDSAYQPAATFDIFQSLVAIQTGIVKDDTTLLVPGGTTTLRQAFQGKSDTLETAFRDLFRRIGKDTLQKWIDSLHYGRGRIGSGSDSFWLDNQLKITSDEQLGFLKKLYFDQLPFFNRPQQIVRRMMPAEKNSNYQLYYKAGQGITGSGTAICWLMGWVEENQHPYFFVINLEGDDPKKELYPTGLQITKKVLTQMGFFQGKK